MEGSDCFHELCKKLTDHTLEMDAAAAVVGEAIGRQGVLVPASGDTIDFCKNTTHLSPGRKWKNWGQSSPGAVPKHCTGS